MLQMTRETLKTKEKVKKIVGLYFGERKGVQLVKKKVLLESVQINQDRTYKRIR